MNDFLIVDVVAYIIMFILLVLKYVVTVVMCVGVCSVVILVAYGLLPLSRCMLYKVGIYI